MAGTSLNTYFVWPGFVNLAHYMKNLFAEGYKESKTLVNASAKLLDAISIYTGDLEADKPLKGYKYQGYSYAAVDTKEAVRLARRISKAIDDVEACTDVRAACSKLLDYAVNLDRYKRQAESAEGKERAA